MRNKPLRTLTEAVKDITTGEIRDPIWEHLSNYSQRNMKDGNFQNEARTKSKSYMAIPQHKHEMDPYI